MKSRLSTKLTFGLLLASCACLIPVAPVAVAQTAYTLSKNTNTQSKTAATESQQLYDINSASLERLMQIPEMKESVAKAIIKGRPYLLMSDLRGKEILDANNFNKFKKHFTLS